MKTRPGRVSLGTELGFSPGVNEKEKDVAMAKLLSGFGGVGDPKSVR